MPVQSWIATLKVNTEYNWKVDLRTRNKNWICPNTIPIFVSGTGLCFLYSGSGQPGTGISNSFFHQIRSGYYSSMYWINIQKIGFLWTGSGPLIFLIIIIPDPSSRGNFIHAAKERNFIMIATNTFYIAYKMDDALLHNIVLCYISAF